MDAAQERRATFYLVILSLTHAVTDVTSGAVMALLPAFREYYSLSYTMVGNIMLVSSLTFSLTQPLFGWISDRAERRWLLPVSLLLGGAGLAAAGWMSSYWLMLAAVAVSTMGTAAFHPEGAHAAYHLSGGRKARAMGIYTVGGNVGFGIGPTYAALLLSLGDGLRGTTFALLLPLLLAAALFRMLPRWQAFEQISSTTKGFRPEDLPSTDWAGIILVTLIAISRSVIQYGTAAFIPFIWIDALGNRAESAPYVQFTYLIAGAAGTLIGSPLADRWGPKRMLILSFALMVPLHALLPLLAGWALVACLFAAGFAVASTYAVTLVMTQDYMPRRLGVASGVSLGLAFGMGGVGTLLLGMLADRWGVFAVLWAVAALVLPTLALATLLPVRRFQPPARASASAGVSPR